MSMRIEAPVVVNPDIDSKNASTGLDILPDIRKGNAPKIALVTHPNVTIANPSLTLISDSPLVVNQAINPIPAVIPTEMR